MGGKSEIKLIQPSKLDRIVIGVDLTSSCDWLEFDSNLERGFSERNTPFAPFVPRSVARFGERFFPQPHTKFFSHIFLRHCNCHWVARRRYVFGYKKEYSVNFFPSVRIFPMRVNSCVRFFWSSAESAQPQTDHSHGIANPWKSKETACMWSSIVVG